MPSNGTGKPLAKRRRDAYGYASLAQADVPWAYEVLSLADKARTNAVERAAVSSNCATAAGPAARTASEAPATPALLLAWMPMLSLTGDTRRWEPKRLRFRMFSAAAQLVHTDRRHWLRFTTRWPWTSVITNALDRLRALPNHG